MIKLYFPIDPVAKGRPRVTRRGHCYTPQKTREFEETIKHLASLQMHNYNHTPSGEPLHVKGYFFIRKPKKPKNDFPVGRPDLDNLIKAIFDALNGIVWVDDSQVVNCSFSKQFSDKGSITLFIHEKAKH